MAASKRKISRTNLWAIAIAVPDFAFEVLFATEQDGFALVAAGQDEHGLRFGKTGEVIEIAVGGKSRLIAVCAAPVLSE